MSGLQPEGENARRAVRWISDQRSENPQLKLATLLDQLRSCVGTACQVPVPEGL